MGICNFIDSSNGVSPGVPLVKIASTTGPVNSLCRGITKSPCFISSSLWEDPGFVTIEAGYCNVPVISSNCDNGPQELLLNGKAGFLFQSNSKDDLLKAFKSFMSSEKGELYKKSVYLKKKAKSFSMYSHFTQFNRILKSIETKI